MEAPAPGRPDVGAGDRGGLMPQVRKPDVDRRIRDAALQRFAADGYEPTSMGSIAATAQVATGNLYRYYPDGKRQLFETVVTEELADTLGTLTRERVGALMLPLDDTGGHGPEAAQLLDFWSDHRLEVVVLLDRAAGTRFAAHGERFTRLLVDLAVERLRADGTEPDPTTRHLLRTIFDGTRRALVAILEHHEDRQAIRHAIGGFWAYQLPGLDGFHRWSTGTRPA